MKIQKLNLLNEHIIIISSSPHIRGRGCFYRSVLRVVIHVATETKTQLMVTKIMIYIYSIYCFKESQVFLTLQTYKFNLISEPAFLILDQ